MSYMQISTRDDDDHISGPPTMPASPPPPFTSRPGSPSDTNALLERHDPLADDAERTLAETFDSPSDDDEDDDQNRDGEDRGARRRLIPSSENNTQGRETRNSEPPVERRVTQYPAFAPTTTRLYGSGRANDGVFANLSAKPSQTEEVDEKPPVSEHLTAPLYTYSFQLLTKHRSSPTNKPPPTPPLPTGKPPSSPPASSPTKSTSTVCPSARSSPSSGMA
jgi:hypothetical protein